MLIFLPFILTLLLKLTSAEQFIARAPVNSNIAQLFDETFKNAIDSSKLAIVEFYTPWSYYSQIMIDEYMKASDAFKNDKSILFAQVDCKKQPDLCNKHNVTNYPDIRIYKDYGSDELFFIGHRTAENFITTINDVLQDPVTVINNDDSILNDFIQNSPKDVIIHKMNNNLNSTFNQTFYAVAKNNSMDFNFVSFISNDVNNEELSIFVNKEDDDDEDTTVSYNGNLSKFVSVPSTLMNWVHSHTLPLLDQLNSDNFGSYVTGDVPLAYFFYIVEQEFDEYSELLTSLAKQYRHKLNFVGINAMKFGKQVDNLNLLPQFPLFAIHNMTNNRKYSFPQMSPEEYANITEPLTIDQNDITNLCNDFIQGKAEPVNHSQPEPEIQENENVYELVGSTHDNYVNENENTIVIYYSPWDNASKQTLPLFEKTAEVLSKNDNVNIKFAKANAFNNDILSVSLIHYPVIIIHTDFGKKSVTMDGNKSIELFFKFINEQLPNHEDIDIMNIYNEYKTKLLAEHGVKEEKKEEDNEQHEQVIDQNDELVNSEEEGVAAAAIEEVLAEDDTIVFEEDEDDDYYEVEHLEPETGAMENDEL